MRSLLNFLERYNNLIIFLILEGIAIYFLTTRNYYHNARAVSSIRWVTQGVEERITNARNYFHLRDVNSILAAENTALRNSINRLVRNNNSQYYTVSDTVYQQQYQFTTARLTSNSVNKQKNFFTINKGTQQGLTNDMAIIGGGGVAGIIVGCSENFSVAMSVLNSDFRLSARIKSNGYFGSLSWDGRDYRRAILNDIPQHVNVNIGDTVETTGYSTIFPEGIFVGTITDYEKPGSDFYTIYVQLVTDFKKLQFVDVVSNKRKQEFLDLEGQFK